MMKFMIVVYDNKFMIMETTVLYIQSIQSSYSLYVIIYIVAFTYYCGEFSKKRV